MHKKQVFGVLILFLCLVVSAHAKSIQPPPKQITADDIVAKMKAQLQLTDKQVDEVKPIIENYLAQEEQVKLDEKKQLRKVLTGEQMYAWNFIQNDTPREKKKHSL